MKPLSLLCLMMALSPCRSGAQIDHLEPTACALYEDSFMNDRMLRVRDLLKHDPETAQKTYLIQIVSLVGPPMPGVDIIQLVQHGSPYQPDQHKYSLILRTVIAPEAVFGKGEAAHLKATVKEMEMDSHLAKRMVAVWTALVQLTRYAKPGSVEPLLDVSGYEYHAVFALGEGLRSGFASDVRGKWIGKLYEADMHLRKWIQSAGKDDSERGNFTKLLELLEEHYLKDQGPR